MRSIWFLGGDIGNYIKSKGIIFEMESHGGCSEGRIERGYKSKAEVQIARFFERRGIAYKYEYPLAVVDKGKTRIWYPDFYLSDYGIIVEYFGINGDPGYDERTKHKIEVYKGAGLEGLFLTNESFTGNWPTRIMNRIESILKGRLGKFNNKKNMSKTG